MNSNARIVSRFTLLKILECLDWQNPKWTLLDWDTIVQKHFVGHWFSPCYIEKLNSTAFISFVLFVFNEGQNIDREKYFCVSNVCVFDRFSQALLIMLVALIQLKKKPWYPIAHFLHTLSIRRGLIHCICNNKAGRANLWPVTLMFSFNCTRRNTYQVIPLHRRAGD